MIVALFLQSCSYPYIGGVVMFVHVYWRRGHVRTRILEMWSCSYPYIRGVVMYVPVYCRCGHVRTRILEAWSFSYPYIGGVVMLEKDIILFKLSCTFSNNTIRRIMYLFFFKMRRYILKTKTTNVYFKKNKFEI